VPEVLTLAELLETRPLEPLQLTYVALGLIQALEQAHRQKQVRGHLTPRDILLTDPISLTATSAPPDAYYETPDHLYDDPITVKTDLYAYGLILYELLTRRPPFVASNDEVLRQRQMEAPVPDPRIYNPDLSLDLLILLLSLLDKEPFFRPASAAEVHQRLLAIWQLDTVGALPDGLLGKLLGRCQVESLIGEGQLAWVFLARDIFDEQPVAVKVFKPAVLRDPRPLARFRRDAPKLFPLDSPHIAQPLAAGEFAGLWYLLIRYVRGRSLRDLIDAAVRDEAPFSRREVLAFVNQIAQASTVIHERGLAHGDLTPNNVILTGEGRAVLTDLSLAAVQDVESDVGSVQGTPAYAAPEQIRTGTVTPATDLYALGAVAYELLAGQPPFTGETPAEVLIQHLEDAPPPVQSRRPELPSEIDIVLRRALDKDPANRFETPMILARALENAWYVPPPPPPPEPPPPPKPPLLERFQQTWQDPAFRRRIAIGALVLAIVLGVGLLAGAGALLLNACAAGQLAPAATPTRTATPTATPTAAASPTVTSTRMPATARTYRAVYRGKQPIAGGFIRGQVFNAAGHGEGGVLVELYNANKQWMNTVGTGANGWYEFIITGGGYYLRLKNRNCEWSPLIELKFGEQGIVDWYAR